MSRVDVATARRNHLPRTPPGSFVRPAGMSSAGGGMGPRLPCSQAGHHRWTA
jgi:hypothetical protein